jgi:hypothetical protein
MKEAADRGIPKRKAWSTGGGVQAFPGEASPPPGSNPWQELAH